MQKNKAFVTKFQLCNETEIILIFRKGPWRKGKDHPKSLPRAIVRSWLDFMVAKGTATALWLGPPPPSLSFGEGMGARLEVLVPARCLPTPSPPCAQVQIDWGQGLAAPSS